MTGSVIIATIVLLGFALLAFDWVRTHRMKKALAAGGKTPRTHTGARSVDSVSTHNQSRLPSGNDGSGANSGGGFF